MDVGFVNLFKRHNYLKFRRLRKTLYQTGFLESYLGKWKRDEVDRSPRPFRLIDGGRERTKARAVLHPLKLTLPFNIVILEMCIFASFASRSEAGGAVSGLTCPSTNGNGQRKLRNVKMSRLLVRNQSLPPWQLLRWPSGKDESGRLSTSSLNGWFIALRLRLIEIYHQRHNIDEASHHILKIPPSYVSCWFRLSSFPERLGGMCYLQIRRVHATIRRLKYMYTPSPGPFTCGVSCFSYYPSSI